MFTDDEVKSTWNKVLSQEYLDSDDLLLYFNADGERYNEPKDKSKYNRRAEWLTDPNMVRLSSRSNVVANCVGCFNYSMPAFCIPDETNTGFCGDGIVMGDEECDGGEGCDDNCKCVEGYSAHGLPYCKKDFPIRTATECIADEVIEACIGAMDPKKCDCECFKTEGIECLLKRGCDFDTASATLYSTWGACLDRCPHNYYCYDLGKEQMNASVPNHSFLSSFYSPRPLCQV